MPEAGYIVKELLGSLRQEIGDGVVMPSAGDSVAGSGGETDATDGDVDGLQLVITDIEPKKTVAQMEEDAVDSSADIFCSMPDGVGDPDVGVWRLTSQAEVSNDTFFSSKSAEMVVLQTVAQYLLFLSSKPIKIVG